MSKKESLTLSDDSETNCRKAEELGWVAVHLIEDEIDVPSTSSCKNQIKELEELRSLFPQFLLNR